MKTQIQDRYDLCVVGGGLAGLSAAALHARQGARVALFEKRAELGGRAGVDRHDGCTVNRGAHALYRAGAGMRVLRRLGITPKGAVPPTRGLAVMDDVVHPLPMSPGGLLTSSLLRGARLDALRMFTALSLAKPSAHADTTTAAWVAGLKLEPEVRLLFEALARLASYCGDLETQSAEVSLTQLQLATKASVLYLDGGWAQLTEALRKVASDSGVEIFSDLRVAEVRHDAQVHGLRLGDGREVDCHSAVLAVSPQAAETLVSGSAAQRLQAHNADRVPIRAACLDLTLDALPDPDTVFALGLEDPIYFSVHSATAKLAPEDRHVLHLHYYGDVKPENALAAFEALLDRVQPGWRACERQRWFRPKMVVSHDLTPAERGGLSGRFAPGGAGVSGLWVCGDWVGREGALADAAFASAEATVEALQRKAA